MFSDGFLYYIIFRYSCRNFCFCVTFCKSLFVLLYFFFWPLLLSVLLRLTDSGYTPLVSSNLSLVCFCVLGYLVLLSFILYLYVVFSWDQNFIRFSSFRCQLTLVGESYIQLFDLCS